MPQNLTTAHSNCSCRLQNRNRKTERERTYANYTQNLSNKHFVKTVNYTTAKGKSAPTRNKKKEEKQNSTSVSTIIKLHFT